MEEDPHSHYVNTKLNPIVEDLVAAILTDKPDEVVDYIIEWCRIRKGELPPKQKAETASKAPPAPAAPERTAGKLPTTIEEDASSDEDEDDYFDDEVAPGKKDRGARGVVMAEVYGENNPKGNYVPRVFEKTAEQKERIIERLSRAFMFSALDEKERDIVVNSMEERKMGPGEMVIEQGADGAELFVVDTGTADCFKKFGQATEDTFLKTYQPGEAFGELALLYNAPRAATIKTTSDCIFWVLDRECFNHIVKDSSAKKRERYEKFLTEVHLLDEMDPYERSKLADAFVSESFKAGQNVITEGDKGDKFYFLEEGEAIATKALNPGEDPVEVDRYASGSYFGELALLNDEPRAANIVAVSDITVVSIDRDAFTRLLGPLQEILGRNSKKYEEVLNKLRK